MPSSLQHLRLAVNIQLPPGFTPINLISFSLRSGVTEVESKTKSSCRSVFALRGGFATNISLNVDLKVIEVSVISEPSEPGREDSLVVAGIVSGAAYFA